MDELDEKVFKYCSTAPHPITAKSIAMRLGMNENVVQGCLLRLFESDRIYANANVNKTMDGDIVSHVHEVLGVKAP